MVVTHYLFSSFFHPGFQQQSHDFFGYSAPPLKLNLFLWTEQKNTLLYVKGYGKRIQYESVLQE